MTAGQLTYELRRLRLHGLIERVAHTNKYQVTPFGLQVAMFFTRTHNRLLRTGLSEICDPVPLGSPLRRHFDKLEAVITDLVQEAGLAA
jgi:predicted MarR family transcription regulator